MMKIRMAENFMRSATAPMISQMPKRSHAWRGTTGGWVRLDLSDAWVWDMFRPARFVSSVRVVTRHDVNVEELRQDATTIPDAPEV